MTGQTIAHYRILEKIGEGGMGIVYKAEDTKLHRIVALKCLRDGAQNSGEYRARFTREAQAAAGLDHPNICSVYELGEADGQMFLAMAYIEGHPLSRMHAVVHPSLYRTLRIVIQIGEGLRAAHKKGIVHRDIKGENILITMEGDAKITDFGLALIRDRSRLTQPGTIMGTITHMSPEQALGKPTDRRTDIWSLGVVLFHLTEGRLPFKGDNAQATMKLVVCAELPPFTSARGPTKVEIERILRKALAKEPAERYQYIDDFLVDLRAVFNQLPQEAARAFVLPAAIGSDDPTMTLPPTPQIAPGSRRSPATLTANQLLVLALLSVLALAALAALAGLIAVTR